MESNKQKRILVAPLDWGLGHTSRCVPIIQELQQNEYSVLFAGNETQRHFIEETFPGIETIHLPGYDVRYTRSPRLLIFFLLLRLPHIIARVRTEQQCLRHLIASQHIDAVISDNRYGLYTKDLPTVFLTHQINVRTGMGRISDIIFRKIQGSFWQKFSALWIVDQPSEKRLAGMLSTPSKRPQNAKYAGWLSAFPYESQPPPGNHLLVLLSGPEPQRSMLSQILWKEIVDHDENVIFIEGSRSAQKPKKIPKHVVWERQLTRKELAPYLRNASLVLCRSGYSSLMDLVALRKKAIVIPTPGQTEQEYLGKHLHEMGVFLSIPQKNFHLKTTLQQARDFPFHPLGDTSSFSRYKNVLVDWLKTIDSSGG